MVSPSLQDAIGKYAEAKTNISPINKLFILYEELVQRLNLVKNAIENEDAESKTSNLNEAIRIVVVLDGLLDQDSQYKKITQLFKSFYYNLVLDMQNLAISNGSVRDVEKIVTDLESIRNVLKDKFSKETSTGIKENTSDISVEC